MLILDLLGISFHAAVVFGLGKNLLFKSILGRCVMFSKQINYVHTYVFSCETLLFPRLRSFLRKLEEFETVYICCLVLLIFHELYFSVFITQQFRVFLVVMCGGDPLHQCFKFTRTKIKRNWHHHTVHHAFASLFSYLFSKNPISSVLPARLTPRT